MFKIGDLHIHSIHSDGSMTPCELVHMAKFYGVDIMAISDHNVVSGIDEAIEEGKRIDVEVIPAVEISSRYNNAKVHVLGYFKDDSYKNDMFNEILINIKRGQIDNVRLNEYEIDEFLRRSNLIRKNKKLSLKIKAAIKIYMAALFLINQIWRFDHLSKNSFGSFLKDASTS